MNYNTNKLNVSAKSYGKGTSKVHILNKSPFTSFLSSMKNPTQAHWLNIVRNNDNTLLTEAQAMLKKMILFKGLVGTGEEGANADTMILYDNNHIFVKTMREIYDSVLGNNFKGFNVSGVPYGNNIPSGNLIDVYQGLHQYKISASLNKTAIRGNLRKKS